MREPAEAEGERSVRVRRRRWGRRGESESIAGVERLVDDGLVGVYSVFNENREGKGNE